MPYGTVAADVLSNSNGQTSSTVPPGFRNRIINGAMVIDQRNAGASVTPTASAYTVDRWQAILTQSSKFSVQQNAGSVTPPVGFTNYLGCTSLSAFSVGSSDYFLMQQYIEGLNTADLAWGTANAKAVTLSFQVYSSLTGTFGGAISNSNFSRNYPFSYTISSANTWTTISITVAGDTTGTWNKNNAAGIGVSFSLGSGSTVSGTANTWSGTLYTSVTGATSVVGTNGATFYITGVQLEVGSSATSFEVRDYGRELILCQRYYQLIQSAVSAANASTSIVGTIQPIVNMRVAPTAGQTGVIYISDFASGDVVQSSTSITTYTAYANMVIFGLGNYSGLTTLRPYFFRGNNSNAVTLSAEL